MLELHGFLVCPYRQHIETAGRFEPLRSLVFLRVKKVTGRIPDFVLLEGVYTSGRVPLPDCPHRLDFYKNHGFPVSGDNVQLATTIGVVSGKNFVAFTAQVSGRLGLYEIPFLSVYRPCRIKLSTFHHTSHITHPTLLIDLHSKQADFRNGEVFVFAFKDVFQVELEFCGFNGLDGGVLHTLDVFKLDLLFETIG